VIQTNCPEELTERILPLSLAECDGSSLGIFILLLDDAFTVNESTVVPPF
jgi:hypothetical protein